MPQSMSWKDWVAVVAGLVVAFLLSAPLVFGLPPGGRLDSFSLGWFVLGLAVLVMVFGIVFDRDRRHRYLDRGLQCLVVAGAALLVLGMLVG